MLRPDVLFIPVNRHTYDRQEAQSTKVQKDGCCSASFFCGVQAGGRVIILACFVLQLCIGAVNRVAPCATKAASVAWIAGLAGKL